MAQAHVINADLIAYLRGNRWLAQNGFIPKAHAIVCDPPYGLAFMGKHWDTLGIHEFQAWVTEWAELLLDYVHPGAVGMFFGGTRTYHRLAAGLEDAGWEIADSIVWCYGSGFPKSHNIGKATGDPKWIGFGSSLKPAYEPVVICRAPRGKRTYAALAREFGTGALAVDAGRIPASDKAKFPAGIVSTSERTFGNGRGLYNDRARPADAYPAGRWPANFALVCECDSDDHADGCPVRVLGEQSGETVSSDAIIKRAGGFARGLEQRDDRPAIIPDGRGHADAGTAARFFYTAKAATWEREAGLDERERAFLPTMNDGIGNRPHNPEQPTAWRANVHPTVKPIRIAEYLARLALPPAGDEPRRLLIPFAGSGSEMIGAALAGWDVITGIERETEYADIARARLAWWSRHSSYEAARKAYSARRKTADDAQIALPMELP